MRMDGNIRVHTDAMYKELYNNMKNNGVIEDFHELFFLCACIGYRKGEHAAIQKRDDRFWSRTITPKEWACYYAMIFEKSNFDYEKLSEDKKVLEIVERYANAGVKILIEDFLEDYLLPNSNNSTPQLDPACCRGLPKQFVHFIFEQAEMETWDR